MYGKPDTAFLLQSETADDLAWSQYATPKTEHETQPVVRAALSRIVFTELSHPLPLHALVQRAKELQETHRRVLVIVGRSKRFVQDPIREEVKQLVETYKCPSHEMIQNTIGDVGTAFVIAAGASNGVMVMQAAGSRL